MKKYKVLIFDADHTLLDYKADELGAFSRLFESLGISVGQAELEWAHRLSEQAWTQAGLYDVESERIQKEYHALYRSHVSRIFEQFFEKYPCTATPLAAGREFLRQLCVGGNILFGAERTLQSLSKKTGGEYRVCTATNGLTDIQTGRLQALEKYCEKIFISEQIGAIKPTAAFFNSLLTELEVEPKDCLMIGDSLSSDVLGGARAGMHTCWFNSRGQASRTDVQPTFEIKNLLELLQVL